LIRIGQILTTHGIRGEVKVLPLTDNPKRYDELEYAYLELSPEYKKVHIESVKYHQDVLLIKFKEYPDINAAEQLRNTYICITREQLMPLPPDHYYIFDLIGLNVYEKENYLGKIKDVISTGSNDVYVVENDTKEILLPALKSVIKSIDLTNKKVFVELPPGLLD